ncbi:heavy-metal-associated domain-containing protein [Amycolatopsis sp. H6(2020)]|nr:heavy-metal-associated domain-containing protein [Amycolatopsis sp. H6(2020)]
MVTYLIDGMTSGQSALTVVQAICRLTGVEAVDVDLVAGKVDVVADRPVPVQEVAAAISETGCRLTPDAP